MKTVINVQPKTYNRRGIIYTPKNTNGVYHAEINRDSIRIFGVQTNVVPQLHNTEEHGGGCKFNKTFKIGDHAEYDSYNLKYVGKIILIGAKSVTIQAYGNENHRLDLYHFIWRNWNFVLDEVEKYNSEERMYI